jgi:hypothetical protein
MWEERNMWEIKMIWCVGWYRRKRWEIEKREMLVIYKSTIMPFKQKYCHKSTLFFILIQFIFINSIMQLNYFISYFNDLTYYI